MGKNSIGTLNVEDHYDHLQVNPAFFFDDDTDANTKLCMDLFAKEMSFKEYR